METRHSLPGFDLDAFKAFLNNQVDAVAQSVEAVDAGACGAAVETAYDIGLELVAGAMAGPTARAPWVDLAWQRLAPVLGKLLAVEPSETLGTISNAVIRMGTVSGVRVRSWLDDMERLAGQCKDVAELRRLGAVCAWRAGMAHLRGPALEQALQLAPSLARAALGAPTNAPWPEIHASLLANPWSNPDGQSAQGWTVGSFSGFGGPFPAPPQVRGNADGFVVSSDARHFLVVADAFGAVVLPASAEEFAAGLETSAPALKLGPSGASLGGKSVESRLPSSELKAVSNKRSVALFSPWSHRIFVLPLPA
jgi:hypothetical protein